jgi:hypothetical protein
LQYRYVHCGAASPNLLIHRLSSGNFTTMAAN